MGLLGSRAALSKEDLQAQFNAQLAALETQAKKAEKSAEFEVVIAASGAKGGFLRDSHTEISNGLIYCSIVKWSKGECYTTDNAGQIAVWTSEEILGSSLSLRLPLEAIKTLEKEFNKRAPSQMGGRACQVKVVAEESFTMNTEGVFFCTVIDMGDLMAPEGIIPSITEQKELMAKKKAESKNIRNTRIQAGRSAREASRKAAQQTAMNTSQEMMNQSEGNSEVSEEDLANVGV
jgi:hypothetical protein